jgi:hypothetical protein
VTAEDWREMHARLDRRTEPVGTAIPFIERSTGRRLEARVGQEASFINGAVLPVDGGRSILGQDPEEA